MPVAIITFLAAADFGFYQDYRVESKLNDLTQE